LINFEHLKITDTEVYNLIVEEYNRQNNGLELIASENLPSESVLEAQASYHTLKYAEGYPGERYYGRLPHNR
jgi:glycine hydroxymethyltransferase